MAARVWRIAKSTVLLGLIAAPVFAGATRPDPLAGQANCDSYQGTAVGANDPTQLFELRVCPSATGVSARLQSSSLVSGYSVRVSEGSWDPTGKTLTLVESAFLENRPEPDWHFCLIDELVLDKTATGLEGTYVSVACDDRATLKLEAITPAVDSSTPPTTSPPMTASQPGPSNPPIPPPKREAPPSVYAISTFCACTSVDPRGASPMPMVLGLGLLAALKRRRSRGREHSRVADDQVHALARAGR